MARNERIRAEVDAIDHHCRSLSPEETVKWINFCYGNLLSSGWSIIDCDEVEDNARFRLALPPARRS